MKRFMLLLLVLVLTVPAFSQVKYFSAGERLLSRQIQTTATTGISEIKISVVHDSTVGSIYFCLANDSTQAIRLRSITGYGETFTFSVQA